MCSTQSSASLGSLANNKNKQKYEVAVATHKYHNKYKINHQHCLIKSRVVFCLKINKTYNICQIFTHYCVT